MHAHRLIAALVAGIATAALLTAGSTPVAAASRALAWDFNGDGYRDLVVGMPGGTANGVSSAGYVVIVPGSASGPVSSRKRIVSQETSAVPGGSEYSDFFGSGLASQDLNSDGYAELIVAAPGEDESGRVTILWSDISGFTRGTAISSVAEQDFARWELAVAEVTGDGRADIVAVGGPGEQLVQVIAGPFSPTSTPAVTEVGRIPDPSIDAFAVGDFDGDHRNDVALSVARNPGTYFLRGTEAGLVETHEWYAETTGRDLVAGDVDKDGYTDLAYGDAFVYPNPGPGQYPTPNNVGGIVRIVYGSPQGPAGARPPVDITQDTQGVPGTGTGESEFSDWFGNSLATADIDGDGYRDLAIAAPGEDLGTATDTGAVTVLYGSTAGFTGDGAQFFSQGTPGIYGSNEDDDHFGSTLRLRDLTGNVRPELIIGVPWENNYVGRVAMLPGTTGGITASGDKSYSPSSLGLKIEREQFGHFIG